MLYKILGRGSVVVLAAFIIISGVLIGINRKHFPEAKEVYSDSAVEWCGCEIIPVSKEVYSVDEYLAEFPNDKNYSYLKNNGKDYSDDAIVVVKIKVKNNSSDKVSFLLSNMCMELYPYMASNGIPIISGKTRIEPGEEVEQTGAVLFTPTQLRDCSIEKVKNSRVQLVISYYPEKIAVLFE